MSANYVHYVCDHCWASRFDRGHDPKRSLLRATAPCCKCGKRHASGIYVREDPEFMQCKGEHGDERDEQEMGQ